MTQKKDLTRIEDLSEYLHQLDDEEAPPEIPEAPFEETVEETASFGEEASDTMDTEASESLTFGDSSSDVPDDVPPFEEPVNEELETSTFSSEETTDFSNDDLSFGSNSDETTETSFESSDSTDFSDATDSFSSEPAPTELTKTDFGSIDDTSSNDFGSDFKSDIDDEPQTLIKEKPQPENQNSTLKIRENLMEEVKTFTENTAFNNDVKSETQPGFSLIIRNVMYDEDKEDIVTLLKEFNALANDTESAKSSLDRGALLIPRLSEFSAIFLCHKLRRFNADITMGLSDLMHPMAMKKNSEQAASLSKKNLYQNQSESFTKNKSNSSPEDVRITTTTLIEGHQVKEYLGIVCDHEMLEDYEVLEHNSNKLLSHYDKLSEKLKVLAAGKKANALIGLQYQLTNVHPVNVTDKNKYLLQATANAVWIEKNS